MAAVLRLYQIRKFFNIFSGYIIQNTLKDKLFLSGKGIFAFSGKNFCSQQEPTAYKNENYPSRSNSKITKQTLPKTSSAIRKCCRQEDFKTARELLDNLFVEHGIHSLTKSYNCIMYHYVRHGHLEECMKLKSEMMARNIPMDDSSYVILASLFVKCGDLKEGKQILKEMRSSSNKVSARVYNSIITAAAKNGDMKSAFELLAEMKRHEKLPCDTCYASIISAAAKHTEEIWKEKSIAIICGLKGQPGVGCQTLLSIKHFFESNKKEMWRVQAAEIDNSGKCSSCDQYLDSGKLSETEHIQLKYQLGSRWQDILSWSPSKNMRCFTSAGNYIDTPSDVVDGIPRSIVHFVETTGPYDVVIDALNVGYKYVTDSTVQACRNRFKPEQVKMVASHFLDQGKRVLVIGGKPMTFGVLRKNHANQFRRALKSSLIFLQEHCGVMLVVDSFTLPAGMNRSRFRLLDDLHILCAAMHCGPDTQLVSSDKFSDHIGHMDQTSRSAFQRWYRLNQIHLETFIDGLPIFEKEPPFNPVVQMTNDSWHFPSEVTSGKWMCAKLLSQEKKENLD